MQTEIPLNRLCLRAVSAVIVVAAFTAFARAESGQNAILSEGTKLYSQHDEELIIRDFFKDRRGGVFVDVGAYEWQKFSTTYYLEKHLGWSGIAIDAQARFAAGYEANRPKTKFFVYIVTDHSGGTETLFLADGLSSTHEEHIERWSDGKDKPNSVEVPTITLNDLLAREGITKVDFLSMDIEEGEPAALAGFDIKRFKPDLVCIEAGPPVRERISNYFAANDYERIDEYLKHDEVNWYYRPRAASNDPEGDSAR